LLLNVDLEKMFALLRVPWAKTCVEIVGIAAGKMTSISMELGREVSIDEVTEALKNGVSWALNVNLVEVNMTPYEQELSDKLEKEKYVRDEWNFLGKTGLA
jgi:lipoate-protein ligase A